MTFNYYAKHTVLYCTLVMTQLTSPKVNYQPPPPSRSQVPVWKAPPEPPTTPNDPPIVPLYPQILLLRRGREGQRTEVMRQQIKGRTIIPLTIKQPPPKKC